jgi:hypothetical protein
MIEAARISETMENYYQTTRRYNSEDSHLRAHRRENLKSYLENSVFEIGIGVVRMRSYLTNAS